MSIPQPRAIRLIALAFLAGCVVVPPGPLPGEDGIVREFYYTPDQDMLVSDDVEDVPELAAAATRRTVAEIAERRRTEDIRLDQLAYFFRALDGRNYLTTPGRKALVRGHPADSCPVQTIAVVADDPRQGSERAVERALMACHADLDALGLAGRCGCRLLAHDAILHAEPATFEYAVDLPVRLFRNGRLDPVTYFSRAGTTEDGKRGLIVEIANEPLLVITYADTGATEAVANFPDGSQEPAAREPVGFDRGRLRESFTTTTPEGDVLRVIVGP